VQAAELNLEILGVLARTEIRVAEADFERAADRHSQRRETKYRFIAGSKTWRDQVASRGSIPIDILQVLHVHRFRPGTPFACLDEQLHGPVDAEVVSGDLLLASRRVEEATWKRLVRRHGVAGGAKGFAEVFALVLRKADSCSYTVPWRDILVSITDIAVAEAMFSNAVRTFHGATMPFPEWR